MAIVTVYATEKLESWKGDLVKPGEAIKLDDKGNVYQSFVEQNYVTTKAPTKPATKKPKAAKPKQG